VTGTGWDGRFTLACGSTPLIGNPRNRQVRSTTSLRDAELAVATESATPPSIVVVLNWLEELKRLVPTK